MLLIDIDGVMAGSHPIMIDDMRRDGHDVTLEDISSWDFGELRSKSGLSLHEVLDYFHGAWRYRVDDITPLDDGIVDAVNRALTCYDGGIVTANPEPNVRVWLARVGLDRHPFQVEANKDDLDHTVLVEDNPKLLGNGKIVLLRDQPWNRHVYAKHRFHHGSELPALLESVKEHLTYR